MFGLQVSQESQAIKVPMVMGFPVTLETRDQMVSESN